MVWTAQKLEAEIVGRSQLEEYIYDGSLVYEQEDLVVEEDSLGGRRK